MHQKKIHAVYAAEQNPDSLEYKGIVHTSCSLGHLKNVRSPFLTCFKELKHAQHRLAEAYRLPQYRWCPGYLCKFDCWAAAEVGVLTQDRVHDFSDISKQEQFFEGTYFMDALLPLKHMIRRPQMLVKYKGDADLLKYFHTIDARGQDTGLLLDLFEPVEDILMHGFDPCAGFRFKTTNTKKPCADVSARIASGSQPSGLLANSDMLETQRVSIADHQQEVCPFDPLAPSATVPTRPNEHATYQFISRGNSISGGNVLQTELSWDATQPRLEQELSEADNLMAVHNSMQAPPQATLAVADVSAIDASGSQPSGLLAPPQPSYKAPPANAPPLTPAELAAKQLEDARQLEDAGLSVHWCAAAQMQPCTPSPPPQKASPQQAPPGFTRVSVDAAALLAQVQGVGANPEVMAILYAAAGLTPHPAARPKASPPPL